eukprot:TRINITY_DN11457_c0_g1_i1.p1 TRINITY_DN11457_c0_g1~~TRINITY_DN11457_c0_g1_i1.p1  ORF type:complete len:431 (+),score=50.49 TRINITY_DN11457_c0_g1_i1:83-1294(+)
MACYALSFLGFVINFVRVESVMARGSRCGDVRAADMEPSFKSFISKHGRSYKAGSAEYKQRFDLFLRMHGKVVQHNCHVKSLWEAGHTRFSDRTDEELASYHEFTGRLKPRSKPTKVEALSMVAAVRHPAGLPPVMSWKHLQAMQTVQDQGSCGSCWAVATGVVLRAHAEIWSEPRNFSIQQLVSCTPNQRKCGGSGGCDGATGELAMAYALQVGLTTEDEFKYRALNMKCPKRLVEGAPSFGLGGGAQFGMTSYLQLDSNKAWPLMSKLVELGPIATSVAADSAWFVYRSGIMDTCDRDSPIVNHLVTLVGYGQEGDTKFYELMNSWGQDWGEGGFIKLLRTDHDDELCGMDDKPLDGVACEGDDAPVKVCGMCGILYDSVVPIFAGSFAGVRRSGFAAGTR